LATTRPRLAVRSQPPRPRRAAGECIAIAAQYRADARLIEHADGSIDHVKAFDHGAIPVIDRAIVVEGPAAFVSPGPNHRRNATCGMHVGCTVARAREAVAQPEEGALALADQPGKGFDRFDVAAGDARRPGRVPRADDRRVRAAHRYSVRENPSPHSHRGMRSA